MTIQIVKSFVPSETTETQEQDNRKLNFQQIVGTSLRQWRFNVNANRAIRPEFSEIKGSADKAGNYQVVMDELPQEPLTTVKDLINIMKQDASNYYEHFVEKRDSDERRKVYAPFPALKQHQELLLGYLYSNGAIAQEAHGFVPKKGNWTAAAEVAAFMKPNQRYSILTQDLRKAFDSISATQVRKALKESGLRGFQLQAATRIATHQGKLATGSPSSPYILNIIFREIDEKLGNWAKANKVKYVRYADDLSFAIPTWNTKKVRSVRELVRRLFKRIGIELHPLKTKITRLGLDSDSAEIIGLAVQHQKATRPKRLRNKLRGLIRKIRKQRRLESDVEEIKPTLNKLLGLVSYFSGEFKAIREAKQKKIQKLRFSNA
jgi:RNA-directed DNA polymerase